MNPATSSEARADAAPAATAPSARQRRAGQTAALWALAALNVALVLVLFSKHAQPAQAQVGRPSDFLMIPGQVTGITTGIVFIVDTSRGELSGMTYDDTRDRLEPMPKINLANVFNQGGGVGAGAGGGRIKPR